MSLIISLNSSFDLFCIKSQVVEMESIKCIGFGFNFYMISMYNTDDFVNINIVTGIVKAILKGGVTMAHYGNTPLHNFPCSIVINLPPIEQRVSMVVNLCN